jgi:hypothetical protein
MITAHALINQGQESFCTLCHCRFDLDESPDQYQCTPVKEPPKLSVSPKTARRRRPDLTRSLCRF